MSNAIATDHADRIQPVALYDRATGAAIGGSSGVTVQGSQAVGVAPTANPLQIAALRMAAPTSESEGVLGYIRSNRRGGLYVQYLDASGNAVDLVTSAADGFNLLNALRTMSYGAVKDAVAGNWAYARRTRNVLATVTPAVTNGAYSAGDVVGPKLTFTNLFGGANESGEIDGVTLNIKSDQSTAQPRMDLYIFKTDPSATSISDNGAWDLNAADFAKVLTIIPLTTHVDNGGNSTVEKAWPKKFYGAQADAYGYLVARDAITLTSTSDIALDVRSVIY